jgi:ubiquinone/menaquinone biosynthesis C-methylase UbiE
LPYEDKEFDFVYCRHVLEDLIYPFRVIKEMQRVAKAGYIETPSPMAELKKTH